MRVCGAGLILAYILSEHAFEIRDGYFSETLVPVRAVKRVYGENLLSLHHLCPDVWFQALLLFAQAILLIRTAFGCRMSSVASLLLMRSLNNRNPMWGGHEHYLSERILLVLACAPSATTVNYWRRERHMKLSGSCSSGHPEKSSVWTCEGATVLVVVQIVNLFLTSGVSKIKDKGWMHLGEGVISSLVSLRRSRVGEYLGRTMVTTLPAYFNVLISRCVVMTECVVAPALILWPFSRGQASCRAFGTMVLLLLLILFMVCLEVGWFPLFSSVFVVPLFPSFVWDRIDRALGCVRAHTAQCATRPFDNSCRRTTSHAICGGLAFFLFFAAFRCSFDDLGLMSTPLLTSAATDRIVREYVNSIISPASFMYTTTYCCNAFSNTRLVAHRNHYIAIGHTGIGPPVALQLYGGKTLEHIGRTISPTSWQPPSEYLATWNPIRAERVLWTMGWENFYISITAAAYFPEIQAREIRRICERHRAEQDENAPRIRYVTVWSATRSLVDFVSTYPPLQSEIKLSRSTLSGWCPPYDQWNANVPTPQGAKSIRAVDIDPTTWIPAACLHLRGVNQMHPPIGFEWDALDCKAFLAELDAYTVAFAAEGYKDDDEEEDGKVCVDGEVSLPATERDDFMPEPQMNDDEATAPPRMIG